MERLSKKFYLGSWAVANGINLLFFIIGTIALRTNGAGAGILGVIWIPGLYIVIVMLIMFYKAWEAIQDGYARTSPGKAIGFLFIPFFNIYWVFQALWGFSKDYNSYIERHSIETQKLPGGLFLMLIIFGILTLIPFVGIITAIAHYIVGLMLVSKMCAAVNAIPQTVE